MLRNSGPIRELNLAPSARRVRYRAHMRVLADLPAKAFGIVIDKRKGPAPSEQIFELGWTTMMQRLERASHYQGQPFMLLHDEACLRHLARRLMQRPIRRAG